jgi:hypothetical protein
MMAPGQRQTAPAQWAEPAWDLLYPLSEFYREAGLMLPEAVEVEPAAMDPVSRRLLVHDRDMTPTLEAAWGQSLGLRVQHYASVDGIVSRQVLLIGQDDGTVVEMGAIRIYLNRFPPRARAMILERKKPLGAILGLENVAHQSRPVAYFRVVADETVSEALETEPGEVLFGRRNILWNSAGLKLADVVEILPPPERLAQREPPTG